MPLDTLLHNATIVTVNPDFEIIRHGRIGIQRDIIHIVDGGNPGAPLPEAAETVDVSGAIVMPGLVNLHTHLPMTLFRGLADDLPLETWLNEHIFPAESRFIDPEAVRLGSRLACAELLLCGTTTICDGYFLETEVAEAVREAGIRAVLGQGVIDFPAPGVPDPSRNVSHAAAFVERWRDASDRIHPSIFCHSPYTCSADTLQKAKAAADAAGVLFQIHVAETEGERRRTLADHGMPPVAYLNHLGILNHRTLAVHCVWVDPEEIALLAACGSGVAHCPESNMKLASGVAPVPGMREAGVVVGIGTDGSASNNNLDLFAEMDSAAKLHKVSAQDPTVMDSGAVLRMATIEGARAIGLADRIGSLEPGKQADLIVVDTARPHLTPLYHPVSHLVYAVGGGDVTDVMVAGRWRVRNRRVTTLDVPGVMAAVNRLAERIGRG